MSVPRRLSPAPHRSSSSQAHRSSNKDSHLHGKICGHRVRSNNSSSRYGSALRLFGNAQFRRRSTVPHRLLEDSARLDRKMAAVEADSVLEIRAAVEAAVTVAVEVEAATAAAVEAVAMGMAGAAADSAAITTNSSGFFFPQEGPVVN